MSHEDNTSGEDLRLRVEMLEGMVNRLQAERNLRVEQTELGKLSEELEEDNWASAATLVRSVMHERDDLRAENERMRSQIEAIARGDAQGTAAAWEQANNFREAWQDANREIDSLVALLRKAEWAGSDEEGSKCPICYASAYGPPVHDEQGRYLHCKTGTHEPDCELAAALRTVRT